MMSETATFILKVFAGATALAYAIYATLHDDLGKIENGTLRMPTRGWFGLGLAVGAFLLGVVADKLKEGHDARERRRTELQAAARDSAALAMAAAVLTRQQDVLVYLDSLKRESGELLDSLRAVGRGVVRSLDVRAGEFNELSAEVVMDIPTDARFSADLKSPEPRSSLGRADGVIQWDTARGFAHNIRAILTTEKGDSLLADRALMRTILGRPGSSGCAGPVFEEASALSRTTESGKNLLQWYGSFNDSDHKRSWHFRHFSTPVRFNAPVTLADLRGGCLVVDVLISGSSDRPDLVSALDRGLRSATLHSSLVVDFGNGRTISQFGNWRRVPSEPLRFSTQLPNVWPWEVGPGPRSTR